MGPVSLIGSVNVGGAVSADSRLSAIFATVSGIGTIEMSRERTVVWVPAFAGMTDIF